MIDGSVGDIYRSILLAVAENPPVMTLTYPERMQRVRRVCLDQGPVGSSITESCKQIAGFAVQKYSDQRIIEFDLESGSDTLSIVDPSQPAARCPSA